MLLDVCLGLRERYEDWLEMGRGLTRWGLRARWLAVVDGAPGLNKAVDELWPDSDRQRRTVHRLRNVIARLPKRQASIPESATPTGRRSTWPAWRPTVRPGCMGWWASWKPTTAVAALAEDLPALCVHLGYPLRLRKWLRSTNLLERSLGVVKRRTKAYDLQRCCSPRSFHLSSNPDRHPGRRRSAWFGRRSRG